MAQKLTSRQQAQLAWLEALPPKLERMKKVIELMSTNNADEAQQRQLARLTDELKAQAGSISLGALADGFGSMAVMLRRTGGHQVRVRGLREMLAGVRINFEGALREASTAPDAAEDEPAVSP